MKTEAEDSRVEDEDARDDGMGCGWMMMIQVHKQDTGG